RRSPVRLLRDLRGGAPREGPAFGSPAGAGPAALVRNLPPRLLRREPDAVQYHRRPSPPLPARGDPALRGGNGARGQSGGGAHAGARAATGPPRSRLPFPAPGREQPSSMSDASG